MDESHERPEQPNHTTSQQVSVSPVSRSWTTLSVLPVLTSSRPYIIAENLFQLVNRMSFRKYGGCGERERRIMRIGVADASGLTGDTRRPAYRHGSMRLELHLWSYQCQRRRLAMRFSSINFNPTDRTIPPPFPISNAPFHRLCRG